MEDLKNEIWKDVPNTNGVYQISSRKRVRKGDKKVKLSRNTGGKLYARICVNGEPSARNVKAMYDDVFVHPLKDDEYFLTVPQFPRYEVSNYKTIRTKDIVLENGRRCKAKIVRQSGDEINSMAYIKGRQRSVNSIYRSAFKGLPMRDVDCNEECEVDTAIKPVKARDFISNRVHSLVMEFTKFKQQHPERYV